MAMFFVMACLSACSIGEEKNIVYENEVSEVCEEIESYEPEISLEEFQALVEQMAAEAATEEDVIIGQYGASGCGENIASNYQSITNLINGWLNSQGHKENMLNERNVYEKDIK